MTVLPAVAAALLGALLFALGAALQQHEAAGTGGATLAGRVYGLLARPRWLLGGAAVLAGGALHVLALGTGPLTLVQPLGVASLLFALPVAAVLRGRRARPAELAAAGAVAAGLAVLVLMIPAPQAPPRLSGGGALALLVGAAAVALAALGAARTAGPAARAGLLAAGAGAMYGAASTLVRVVADAAGRDPGAVLHWFTAAAAATALVALGLLQGAYAGGHFAVAFATIQVADPLTAVTAGGLLLGDPLPGTGGAALAGAGAGGAAGAVAALGAAALVVTGTLALARTSPIPAPSTTTPSERRRPACPHP